MSTKPELSEQRGRLLQRIRAFFTDHDFVEVQTPLRLAAPALEDHIDAVPAGDGAWLRTSPELALKRLVSRGADRIFELGPCFRAEEHGRRHRTEFTMLEWYQANADYADLIPFTLDLLKAVAPDCPCPGWQPENVRRMTVAEAYARFTDCSLADALRENRFDELMVTMVEPNLGAEGPLFLSDYPASAAGLARLSNTDPPYAERWELYIRGMELANAYSELVDPAEQRRRFEETAARRRADGRDVYPIDEAFLDALAEMPPTAGCALGVDRLLMVLLGVDDIADVRLIED